MFQLFALTAGMQKLKALELTPKSHHRGTLTTANCTNRWIKKARLPLHSDNQEVTALTAAVAATRCY